MVARDWVAAELDGDVHLGLQAPLPRWQKLLGIAAIVGVFGGGMAWVLAGDPAAAAEAIQVARASAGV